MQPNRVALAELGCVVLAGEEDLAQKIVEVYALSGALAGTIELGLDATGTLGEIALKTGVYIFVSGFETARLLVTP